jgi:formylglycine-generating enzyme required for sulfatase activity
MVLIPETKAYNFESTGVMIEGNDLPNAVGVQYPWDSTPARAHKKEMDIKAFYIDRYPVTNSEYKKFMNATKYKPKDDHNFLKDWVNGTYPAGWANKPVTWVSMDDARAYAAWAGKRLPHEWEWQYAAQGTDGRIYPWGKTADSTIVPIIDTSRKMREPTDVDAFPKNISPFGVMDMVGNVWQWTDEYADDHTRSAILKGGSYFKAQRSRWYFPQAYEVNKHGKYLLMYEGRDRSRCIGFRCVAD